MFKKILILMLLLLSFNGVVSAKEIGIDKLEAYSNGNTITVKTPDFLNHAFNPNSTDWIGIYKLGDSNSWSNVKLWVWAKDLKYIVDGFGASHYEFKNINLPSANYEARYFLNNTYITYFKSAPFTVQGAYRDIDFENLIANADKNQINLSAGIMGDFHPNPTDWVGIYKVGDSNEWKNVKLWVWAKKFKAESNFGYFEYHFKNIHLAEGRYEARYFLNNTYTTRIKSATFTMQSNQKFKLSGSFEPNKDHSVFVEIKNKNFNPNPKDWIGVYQVGASNDWSNVQAWLWARDLKKDSNGYYRHRFKRIQLDGMWGDHFELRYFLNNTFHTYQTSNKFELRPGNDF